MKSIKICLDKVLQEDTKDPVSSLSKRISDQVYRMLVHYNVMESDLREKHHYIRISLNTNLYAVIKMINKSDDGSYILYVYIMSVGARQNVMSTVIFNKSDTIYDQLSAFSGALASILADLCIQSMKFHNIDQITVSNNFDNPSTSRQYRKMEFTDIYDVLNYISENMDEDNNNFLIKYYMHLNPGDLFHETECTIKFFVQYTEIFGKEYYSIKFVTPNKDMQEETIGLTLEECLETLRINLLKYYKLSNIITVNDSEEANLTYYVMKEEEQYV